MRIRVFSLLAVIALAVAACGELAVEPSPGSQDGEATPTTALDETTTTTARADSADADDGLLLERAERSQEVADVPIGYQSLVAAAIADLADRLESPVEQITVLSIEEVIWPDGSLGCPQPGMSYTQALVNGVRILLGVDEDVYAYHSTELGPPFLCEQPQIEGLQVPGTTLYDGKVPPPTIAPPPPDQ